MPHLPPWRTPHATVLAWESLGRVVARSCAVPAVSALLAAGTAHPEHTRRRRVRAWDDEEAAHGGAPRPALAVAPCLAARWGGSVRGWQGTPRAVAWEATPWGDRLVVLAVRVGSRGGAMPVAWGILPSSACRPLWEATPARAPEAPTYPENLRRQKNRPL